MKKRITAIFLSLALSVSLLSGIAFADDSNCAELAKAVCEAEAALEEAKEAQSAYSGLDNSYGFYKWMAANENLTDEQRTDASIAVSLLEGEVPSDYSSVILNPGNITASNSNKQTFSELYAYFGSTASSMSLDELLTSLKFIKTGNDDYRNTEGCDDLLVSTAMMAMAELDVTFYSNIQSHPLTFNVLENLAYCGGASSVDTGSSSTVTKYNPYDGWYTDEKAIYDVSGSTSKTGHYETLTDKNTTTYLTGFAVYFTSEAEVIYNETYNVNMYWYYGYYCQLFSDGSSLYNVLDSTGGIDVDKYIEYVEEYEEFLESLDSAVEEAEAALKSAKEAYENAVHAYGSASWSWEDDYSSATATFTCSQCGDVQTVEAEVTEEITNASCTEDGYTTYTAVLTFEDIEYTDTKTITNTGSATGHSYDYDNITWSWADDFSSATATVSCTNDSSHMRYASVSVTSETTGATCESDGKIVYTATASFDGNDETYTDTQTVTLDALGHAYGSASWSWADDLSSATATFTCENDNAHIETITAEISSSTSGNVTTYTATVTFEGAEYTSTKTYEVYEITSGNNQIYYQCSGNTLSLISSGEYGKFESLEINGAEIDSSYYTAASGSTVITISADYLKSLEAGEYTVTLNYSDGIAYATVTVCEHDYEGVVTDPTCTEQGYTTYTCSVCGDSYVSDYTDATGHDYDYDNATWSWDGYTSAVMTAVCRNDESHTDSATAEITSEITTAPTCEETGVRTYTATATLGETTYTDTKEETVDAIGHDYDYDDATWSWDGYTSAVITAVCKNDKSHTDSAEAEITSEITTAPTCEKTGVRTYTATATLGGVTYTDTKEKTIAATGHDYDYESITWEWADDFSSAAATVICSNDSSHTETITATVTKYTTDPVCEEGGDITYTATITVDGVSYTDTQSQTVGAIGHDYDYDNIIWEWAEDYSSATATVVCQNDNSHTLTYEVEITSETTDPTCTKTGETVYTATITVDGNVYTDTTEETVSATGHSFTDYVSNEDATCTEDGTKTAECDNGCGETDTVTDEGSALGHSYESETTDPTCTEDGYTTYTCTVCGDTYTETIDALGHSYGDGVITIEATETEEGVVTYTCTVCGDTYTKTIASLSSIQSLEDVLEEELENLEAEEESDYSSEAYEQALDAYEEAIQNAQDVLSDEYATTQEIEDAIAALEEAYKLLELIKAAEDAADEISSLTESDYTQSSWEAYEEAVEALDALLAGGSLDSEEIEAALAAVNEAKAALTAAETETETEPETETDSEDEDSGDEPDTSDSNNLLTWLILAALAGLCLTVTGIRKKVN